jgi:hypothetical protein
MARTKAECTEENQERVRASTICKFFSKFFCEETKLTYNSCCFLMREFFKIARDRKMTFHRLRSSIGRTGKNIDIDVLIFIMACEKEWREKHSSKNSSKSDADSDSDYNNGSDSDYNNGSDSDFGNTKKRTAKKCNDVTERVPKNSCEAKATQAIPWTTLPPVEPMRRSRERHFQVPLEDAQRQLKDFARGRVSSLGKQVARVLFNDASSVYLKGSTETKPISATAMDEPASAPKWKLVYAATRPEGIFCIWVSNDANTWTGVRPLESIRFG